MTDEYWVKYKGRVHGPFTESQLRSGLKRGKLSRSHGVSTNRRSWQPLGVVLAELDAAPPPMAGVPLDPFAGPPPTQQPATPPPAPSSQPLSATFPTPAPSAQQHMPIETPHGYQNPDAVLTVHSGSIGTQILIGGIAILLAFALPLFQLPNGRFIWIWSLFSEMPGTMQFGVIFAVLSGIGMIVLSVSTRRLARSIPIVSIMLLYFVTSYISVLDNSAPGSQSNEAAGIILLLTGLISSVLLLATAKWRAVGATVARRTLTCIAGSVFSLACLITLVLIGVALIDEGLPKVGRQPDVAPIILLLFLLIGLGLGLTSGILGILQVKPMASAAQNNLCRLFSRLSLAILFGVFTGFLATTAIYAQGITDRHWLGPVLLIVFQASILPLTVLSAFAYATYELLLSCSAAVSKPKPAPTSQPTQPGPPNPFA